MTVVLFLISVVMAFIIGFIGGAYFMKLRWMEADPTLFVRRGKTDIDKELGRIINKPKGNVEYFGSEGKEDIERKEKGWENFDKEIEPSAEEINEEI